MATLAIIVTWGAALIGARLATATHTGRDPFGGTVPLLIPGRIYCAVGGRL
jgi:hypothetical protein